MSEKEKKNEQKEAVESAAPESGKNLSPVELGKTVIESATRETQEFGAETDQLVEKVGEMGATKEEVGGLRAVTREAERANNDLKDEAGAVVGAAEEKPARTKDSLDERAAEWRRLSAQERKLSDQYAALQEKMLEEINRGGAEAAGETENDRLLNETLRRLNGIRAQKAALGPDAAAPRREQAVERVVGTDLTPEQKLEGSDELTARAILREAKEKIFEHQPKLPGEIEKTPEHMRMIQDTLDSLPSLVEWYGGRPLQLTAEQVHLIDEMKLEKESRAEAEEMRKSRAAADYDPITQGIRVVIQPGMSKTEFMKVLAHESLHFNSFHSQTLRGGKLETRRTGLSITAKKRGLKEGEGRPAMEELGDPISEAVTEMLTKRFMEKRLITQEVSEEDIRQGEYAYPMEQARMQMILSQVGVAEGKSNEEVFDTFARGYFSGNLLEIARMVERTYGKGAFRTMMEGRQMLPEPLYMQKQRRERRNRGNAGA